MSDYPKRAAPCGNRGPFVDGLDARIIIGPLSKPRREKHVEVGPGDLADNLNAHLHLATHEFNRRCYEAVIGRMPAGLYVVAVCYAAAVILLGSAPWNVLLLLLLLPHGNKRARFPAFDTRRGVSL